MNALLTLGLRNGKLIDVSEVENGIKCNCFCPGCGEPLIAKANKKGISYKKIPHFAHSNIPECKTGLETALHLLAKEVLLETKILQLPDFHFDYNSKNGSSKFKELEIIEFDSVKAEGYVNTDKGHIIGDIIAVKKGKTLNIEFAKSHFVDYIKKDKIKSKNLATIEIDLKGQTLDRASLKTFFKTKSQNIYWIYNKYLEDKYQNYLIKIKNQIINFEQLEKKKIENNKSFLNEKLKQGKLIFDVTEEYIFDCPLSEKRKNEFINSPYFKIPLLKEIYKGSKWDKVIHGNIHSKFYITLKNEKIFLPEKDSENGRKNFSLVYNGLRMIQEFEKISYLKVCRKCKYHEKEIDIDSKEYLVCGFINK